MRRLDDTKDITEATYMIDIDKFEQFQKCKEDLRAFNNDINITFLDNRGID